MSEEITLHDPDAPPVDALEDAFTLPAPYSEDERCLRWHTEIVTSMRREAAGVPMGTAQRMLMERIAFFYVSMKYKEWNGGLSGRELKEMTAVFLSMLDTFNRLLEKNTDKVFKTMLGRVMGVMNELLPMISDKEEQKRIRVFLIQAFREIEDGS